MIKCHNRLFNLKRIVAYLLNNKSNNINNPSDRPRLQGPTLDYTQYNNTSLSQCSECALGKRGYIIRLGGARPRSR